MDLAQIVREARRHAGYSQRHLAAVSGVSLRTVTDVEKGRRNVSVQLLDGLLAACGLDLSTCQRAPRDVSAEQAGYLALSTTRRLRLHCGGAGDDLAAGPALWKELMAIAEHATFALIDGPDAAGVWASGIPPLQRVCVGVAERVLSRPLPSTSVIEVRGLPVRRAPAAVRGGVCIGLPLGGHVVVPPPAELLLDPRCAVHAERLREAARCLHQQAGRDEAGRRAPPHRDPDELQECVNLSRTLTYALDSRRLPDPTDSRGWRVGASVSLRQWHEESGHPVRRGSRRRE